MATRNFYIKADIDGRRTCLSGGPASKEGGMKITQRCSGEIAPCVKIVCHADKDGSLCTEIRDAEDKAIYRMWTSR